MHEVADPIAKFAQLFEQAKKTIFPEPTAMVLATADADGKPSARVVLMKDFDERGFVFYTNLSSRKGKELQANPHVALCFYWAPLYQQVRVEGKIEIVSDAEADAYFATRPFGSQIGAWASKQSTPLPSRDQLEAEFQALEKKFAGQEVPRPSFWSGFRLIPERIEFWESRENRLHDRTVYTHKNGEWVMEKLYP